MGRCQPLWKHQENMGVESAFTKQLLEGTCWKAQDKYSDHTSDKSTGDNKCTSAWPRIKIG